MELPALTGAARIDVAANPQLQRIALDALARATAFAVTDNPHLPACEVAAVFAHVAGSDNHQSGNDDTATCRSTTNCAPRGVVVESQAIS